MKAPGLVRRLAYGSREWRHFLAHLPRAGEPSPQLERAVRRILRAVEREGDAALVRLGARFDGVHLEPRALRVSPAALEARARQAEPGLVRTLERTARRIEEYHRRQLVPGFRLRWPDGSLLAEEVRALDSAGLYVPGGAAAYPSSVLMNAIPARVAGVERLVVTTPPGALERHPAVAAALLVAGVSRYVFRVGGAQAVGALAYGTAHVPAVAKIVGPGNAYVAEAKRQVRGRVAIDHEAGPSEVVVLADDSADARHVAVDLLAQAEHGSGRETAVLVSPSRALLDRVGELLAAGLPATAHPALTRAALRRHGALVHVRDLSAGVEAVNALAAEHVEVQTRAAARVARRVVGAAVFVGPHSPVALGDYGVGPNHVLPTGRAARAVSPLSVRDFQRRFSSLHMSRAGLARLAPDVARLAEAEGFPAHASSVLTRLQGGAA